MTDEIERLERRCEIADARLGVAEELSWPAALFAGAAVHFKWDSWLAAIGAGLAVYLLAIWRHRRASARAWDEYERATGTGTHIRTAD